MSTVTVQMAFSFWCPECSSKHFVDSVPAELDAEDIADAVDDGFGATDFVTFPDEVECGKCGKSFDVVGCEHP